MKVQSSVLLIDDDQDVLVAGKLLIKRHFTDVTICNNPDSIPKLLDEKLFDAILLDMNFGPGDSSGCQGKQWLEVIKHKQPETSVIMITAHGDIKLAVETMKLGAIDFITKPWQNEKLIATLTTAVELGASRSKTKQLQKVNTELNEVHFNEVSMDVIGNSRAINSANRLIHKAAPTEANVIILGENGTGKELAARQIHALSHRKDKVFMSIDLGSIAENLFESELFGHQKGAFTGADKDRLGRIQAANGGTLFLDEIGNLPLHLQSKLLTTLEQRKVQPLGSDHAIDIDVRVISATNLGKDKLTNEEHFRQDLLFRLNTVEVVLPPLKERVEDIKPLLLHYIEVFSRKYQKQIKAVEASCLQLLERYHWPGNIRALKHAVERAVIMSEKPQFIAEDFLLSSKQELEDKTEFPQTSKHNTANTDVANHSNTIDAPQSLNLEQVEKQTIEAALRKHRFNISHSAKELGLTRAALYRRMEKHGL